MAYLALYWQLVTELRSKLPWGSAHALDFGNCLGRGAVCGVAAMGDLVARKEKSGHLESHSYRRWRSVAADGVDWAHSRFDSRCCRLVAVVEKAACAVAIPALYSAHF